MPQFDQPTNGGSGYPPAVETTSLPNGSIGAAYNQTLQAAYGSGGYSWAVTTGSLPAGLSLAAATGILSGAPTQSGSSYFVITVTDSTGATGAANLGIVIPTQPTIQNSSLPAGTIGVPYLAALSGTGGAAPYTFTVVAGSLPVGLTLASTGGITGTPTTQGTFTFSARVADSANPQGTGLATFSITVQRASLSSSIRTMDECVLVGCGDGAIYALVPGQRHDQDYNGNPVPFLQRWCGVPTSSGKMALNQLGGATVSAKGAGNLNVSAIDDVGNVTALSNVKRPMELGPKETARDFMARGVPQSVRYAPCLDNGAVLDAWFEAHVFMLWMRAFFSGRKG